MLISGPLLSNAAPTTIEKKNTCLLRTNLSLTLCLRKEVKRLTHLKSQEICLKPGCSYRSSNYKNSLPERVNCKNKAIEPVIYVDFSYYFSCIDDANCYVRQIHVKAVDKTTVSLSADKTVTTTKEGSRDDDWEILITTKE